MTVNPTDQIYGFRWGTELVLRAKFQYKYGSEVSRILQEI